MSMSTDEGVRWVVQKVPPDTIRMVHQLASHHDVRFGEVIRAAVDTLWHELYDEGYLPEGWTEY